MASKGARKTKSNRERVRRNNRIAIVLLALLVPLLLVAALGGGDDATGVAGSYTVADETLPVLAAADSGSNVVTTLRQGDEVQVLSLSGAYYKLALESGQVGFALAQSLTSKATTISNWTSEYIDTSKLYTYSQCRKDMKELDAAYADARIENVGESVLGNPIDALVLGNPNAKRRILVHAAMHAREGITTPLVMRQAENLLQAAKKNATYQGVKASTLLKNVEIWVVPVVNPDGVNLVQKGIGSVPEDKQAKVLALNKGSKDFSRWKANIRGVDLNRNFPGYWEEDPSYPKPGPLNFAGTGPLTEPESQALYDLTVEKDFTLTASYHCVGEILYWYGPKQGILNELNYVSAKQISKLTGYRVLSRSSQDPNGGYRDWFMWQYARQGFTIEVATGSAPVPTSSFPSIWGKNRLVMAHLAWMASPKSLLSLFG